ncbi:hypothetical protein BLNAU_20498 [Blattamonas nauphoetae]|uniref:HAT C-terminal dimerisation domain-containing protein n=1 Tax=Blattamonas nauphoetae TaxID=2049346 RepID=A0ABQ9X1U7_9EUKA|nr:hypothetical protein BLNAU_20498 [Blattamonas nauphoetae]
MQTRGRQWGDLSNPEKQQQIAVDDKFTQFEHKLYKFCSRHTVSYNAAGSDDFRDLANELIQVGKRSNHQEISLCKKTLNRRRIQDRLGKFGQKVILDALTARRGLCGSVVIDGGKVGPLHFLLAIFVAPQTTFEPLLIHTSNAEDDMNALFYANFAAESSAILIKHGIKVIGFVADNAIALQNGLRTVDQIDRTPQPEALQQTVKQTSTPLVGRCHNHLLDLAWTDAKLFSPHLKIILETLHNCTRPLYQMKNKFGERSCVISNVFPIVVRTMQTILQNLADSPTRWKEIGDVVIDCLFLRFFCNSTSSLMLFSYSLTREGRDSYHTDCSILSSSLDVPSPFTPLDLVFDEIDTEPEWIDLCEDDQETLSDIEMRGRAARREKRKERQRDAQVLKSTSPEICDMPPILPTKRAHSGEDPISDVLFDAPVPSATKVSKEQTHTIATSLPQLLPLHPLSSLYIPRTGQLSMTMFTYPRPKHSIEASPEPQIPQATQSVINTGLSGQNPQSSSNPSLSTHVSPIRPPSHHPITQNRKALFGTLISEIVYSPPQRHMRAVKTGFQIPSIATLGDDSQSEEVLPDELPHSPSLVLLSNLRSFHTEIYDGFTMTAHSVFRTIPASLAEEFDVWLNHEEAHSEKITVDRFQTFWRQYRDYSKAEALCDCALTMGAMVASEIECERYFSHIKRTFSPSRRRMRPEQILHELAVAFHSK